MSTPTPNRQLTTQEAHPWKATFRTVFQMVIGFIIMLPQLVTAAGLDEATPWVATAIAISGAVTRVMALPSVEAWMKRFIPWLSAQSKNPAI